MACSNEHHDTDHQDHGETNRSKRPPVTHDMKYKIMMVVGVRVHHAKAAEQVLSHSWLWPSSVCFGLAGFIAAIFPAVLALYNIVVSPPIGDRKPK